MSNYNSLKTTIDANIKQNGNQEITGQILNSVLNAMVTTLGTGYQFAGVATIATNPGTPDAKVFYIANGKGTYEKFGGLEVTEDDVVVFYWDSAWHKVATGIASNDKLTELENKTSLIKRSAIGNIVNEWIVGHAGNETVDDYVDEQYCLAKIDVSKLNGTFYVVKKSTNEPIPTRYLLFRDSENNYIPGSLLQGYNHINKIENAKWLYVTIAKTDYDESEIGVFNNYDKWIDSVLLLNYEAGTNDDEIARYGQIKDLQNQITDISKKLDGESTSAEYKQGKFISEDGSYVDAGSFSYTDKMPVSTGDIVMYRGSSGGAVVLACYGKDGEILPEYTIRNPSSYEPIEGSLVITDAIKTVASSNYLGSIQDAYLIIKKSGILKKVEDAISSIETPYKPYQDGFIIFTVPVNQYYTNDVDMRDTLIDNEDNIIDVYCALKLPSTYTQLGKKSKLVMLCHGSGRNVYGEESSWVNVAPYNALVNAFVNAGYAVFDCNGYANDYYGHEVWGAPKGVQAWRKAYDYVVKNYNVDENFSIYGFSMGGLTALNIAFSNFPNIKCVAVGSPVLDLVKCWNGNAKDNMQHSYDMTNYDTDKVAGSNPIANVIDGKCYKSIPPLRIWYGGTETGAESTGAYVEKEDAKKLVNALKSSNSIASYREVEGCGHGICYGENSSVNAEIVMFFNRYSNS